MQQVPQLELRGDRPLGGFTAGQTYRELLATYGPQGWWPRTRVRAGGSIVRLPAPRRRTDADRFEVCVGAILTQNTAWTNVERALAALLSDARARGVAPWEPRRFAAMSPARLARLIRPSGYFRAKAEKLRVFSRWLLASHGGSLARFFRRPTAVARAELLGLWGIGPETADSMLLYAGHHPVFVIDAYAKRFLADRGIVRPTYDAYAQLFTAQLPSDAHVMGEYHALIVAWGKAHRAPSRRAARAVR